MKISESVIIIFKIVLVIGCIWLIGYGFNNHYQQKYEQRNKYFREATKDCYGKERSCDAIFENLYEEVFPEYQ